MATREEIKELIKSCKIVDVNFKAYSDGLDGLVLQKPDGSLMLLETEGTNERGWMELQDVRTLARIW